MYSFPSTSEMRAPAARLTKNGVPSTLRNAWTGEFTPPGIRFCAAANNCEDREFIGNGSKRPTRLRLKLRRGKGAMLNVQRRIEKRMRNRWHGLEAGREWSRQEPSDMDEAPKGVSSPRRANQSNRPVKQRPRYQRNPRDDLEAGGGMGAGGGGGEGGRPRRGGRAGGRGTNRAGVYEPAPF